LHRLLALCVALALCGCTATISRINQPSIEEKILSSEPDALFVSGASTPYRIESKEIRDIDHPGNVVAIIGGAWLVGSLPAMGLMWNRPGELEPFLVINVAPALGLAATGLFTWIQSASSAGDLQRPGARVQR
jgi:hypothetical protein